MDIDNFLLDLDPLPAYVTKRAAKNAEYIPDPKRQAAARKAAATRKARGVDYYKGILGQATRGTLTQGEFMNALRSYLALSGGYRGRKISDAQRAALDAQVTAAVARIKPVYKKRELPQALRDYILRRQEAVGAPWYWNLASVKSSGVNDDGYDRSIVNKPYRDGLIAAMKKFANSWERGGHNAPVHGAFMRHGWY